MTSEFPPVFFRTFTLARNRIASAYRRFRHALSKFGFLRSTWYLMLAFRGYLGGSARRSSMSFAREFADKRDPWNFDSAQGQERFLRVVEILERRASQGKIGRAIEIGCAEGAFTEHLFERCSSLLAVDFAALALERASERRIWPDSVSFRKWNLRKDSLDEKFELVVAMDVLSTIFRFQDLKRVISKLIDYMEPGGYLVLSDPRQCEVFETAWWSRYLIRGGFRILESISQHPDLRVIETLGTETHVIGLLQKTGAPKVEGGTVIEDASPAFDDLFPIWNPRIRRVPKPLPGSGSEQTPTTRQPLQ